MRRVWVWRGIGVLLFSVIMGSMLAIWPSSSKSAQPLSPTPAFPSSATVSTALPVVDDTPMNRRLIEEFKRSQQQLKESYRTAHAEVIGTFTTDLGSHDDPNRVHNIRLSTASIHKTVLLPGETFSFHETIGDSTNDKLGYKPATVIIGKEFATDFGGGICQVSSTLYNAVSRSGLRVAERYSHSLPIDYVPKGQDATVSYPDLDFKFVNSSDYPIRIEAALQGKKVVCTILKVKIGEH